MESTILSSGAAIRSIFEERLLQWVKLELSGDRVPARSSHTAALLDDSMIIFGGHGNGSEYHDFCYVQADSFRCCTVVPTSRKTSAIIARIGHSASVLGDRMYIFGGWNGMEYCSSGFLYDAKAMEIAVHQTTDQNVPTGRRDHACVLVNDTMFLFGGWNCLEQFNDVWTLDTCEHNLLLTGLWVLICVPAWKWNWLKCSGSIPIARRGHTASAVGPYIFVFGGIHGLTRYLDDLYVLDTSTKCWSHVTAQGDVPSPRAWHSSNVVGKYIFIFGGTAGKNHFKNDVYALDLETMIWHQVKTKGLMPEERASHSATLINDRIIVFGGVTPSVLDNAITALDNVFALNVDAALMDSAEFTPQKIKISVDLETD